MKGDGFKKRLAGKPSREAFQELLVTVLTATLPVWFFPAFVAVLWWDKTRSINLLHHSISEGELFLFATSLVGPLFYILFKHYRVPDTTDAKTPYRSSLKFPNAMGFAVTIFIILLTASVIFGLQKLNPQFAALQINETGYLFLSGFIFCVAIIAMFIAMFQRNELDEYSYSDVVRHEEDDFSHRFDEARGHARND